LVAVYFAIQGRILCMTRLEVEEQIDQAEKRPREPIFDDDSPTIWLTDAGTLNKAKFGDDLVFIAGGGRTAPYLPDALREKNDTSNEHPVAIYPARVSERIVAQHGVFTLHGHAALAIDDIPETRSDEIKLARIVLDSARLPSLWDEIAVAGITRHAMFPDLDNVATHIKWECQSMS